LIHWTMSCINSSVEQTFNLVFENTKPAIAPDGTFKDVPLGVDPTQWPLDVDVAKTTKAAQDNPLYPGGQFTVYGDFCWSGDKTRGGAGDNPVSHLVIYDNKAHRASAMDAATVLSLKATKKPFSLPLIGG